MSEWTATSLEDRLLEAYWETVGGRFYTEVPIGWSRGNKKWPAEGEVRYIDAIRLREPYYEEGIVKFSNHSDEFLHAVHEAAVDLIEIKKKLNRPVIGQILAGREMFEADYWIEELRCTALCERNDPTLEWVCDRHEIDVKVATPAE